jgi:hypothetical protein
MLRLLMLIVVNEKSDGPSDAAFSEKAVVVSDATDWLSLIFRPGEALNWTRMESASLRATAASRGFAGMSSGDSRISWGHRTRALARRPTVALSDIGARQRDLVVSKDVRPSMTACNGPSRMACRRFVGEHRPSGVAREIDSSAATGPLSGTPFRSEHSKAALIPADEDGDVTRLPESQAFRQRGDVRGEPYFDIGDERSDGADQSSRSKRSSCAWARSSHDSRRWLRITSPEPGLTLLRVPDSLPDLL